MDTDWLRLHLVPQLLRFAANHPAWSKPSLHPLDVLLPVPLSSAMDRRRVLRTSLAGVLLAPVCAYAQPRPKVYRIGYVGITQPVGGRHPGERLFVATLRDLGYVDDKNLVVEWRYGGADAERYPEIASELVGLRVDAIVTVGMPAVRAVKQKTNTIPIIMAVSQDPVGAGLAASLARPGGNVTGFTRDVGVEVTTKALQVLKEAIPGARVVGMMAHETNPGIERLEAAAAALGIALRRFEIRTVDDIPRIYEALSRVPVDALYVLGNVLMTTHRQIIIDLSAAHRIPTMYVDRRSVVDGGLIAYGIDLNDAFRGAAHYVDRILRGAHPGTLPIQQPTKVDLVINLKTAKALGLTIPSSLLLRADHVVQ